MKTAAPRQDPLVSDVAKLSVGIGGLALCLTLMYLGMRAVMDVGGACADGGPYVSAQSCPEGSAVVLIGGSFGLFLFGGIAMWYGARVGGIWSAAPLLAWSGLFLSLGWNFLSYGVFNTPEGEGIVWSWAICGVLFVLMGGVPLIGGLSVFGSAPLRRSLFGADAGGSSARTIAFAPAGGDPRRAYRPAAVATAMSDTTSDERREELTEISGDLSAAIAQALHGQAAPDGIHESTQALLDRLERLADLRDRGLLGREEYETAKDTIVRELETRQ